MNITATKSGVVFSGKGDTVTNTINYSKDKTADDEEEDKDVFLNQSIIMFNLIF